MTEKRFTLQAIHFRELTVDIFDNLKDEMLHLSIYNLVELLNEVSQTEYTLKQLRDDFFNRFDRVIEIKCDVDLLNEQHETITRLKLDNTNLHRLLSKKEVEIKKLKGN